MAAILSIFRFVYVAPPTLVGAWSMALGIITRKM